MGNQLTRMELKSIISFLRRVYAGHADVDELTRLVNKIETILETGEANAKNTARNSK